MLLLGLNRDHFLSPSLSLSPSFLSHPFHLSFVVSNNAHHPYPSWSFLIPIPTRQLLLAIPSRHPFPSIYFSLLTFLHFFFFSTFIASSSPLSLSLPLSRSPPFIFTSVKETAFIIYPSNTRLLYFLVATPLIPVPTYLAPEKKRLDRCPTNIPFSSTSLAPYSSAFFSFSLSLYFFCFL
ncbi:hypothetical protein F5H01DRAFT_113115 [Linnemannia elongata]|nr:hypothetical protein F5H01DRAFT_113115 [Linnemannia elongata]